MTMSLQDAAARINLHPDLTATLERDRIAVAMYHRPIGIVTASDLQALGHTATGWGQNLHKGRLQVWQALTPAAS